MITLSQTVIMQEQRIAENPLLKSTFAFSLQIIDYCGQLQALKYYPLANQLFKSGTSIGANAIEAQNAESKADFIHKMKIAAKEADEAQYWLKLCKYSERFPDCTALLNQLDEITRILGKILTTSKQNKNRSTDQ